MLTTARRYLAAAGLVAAVAAAVVLMLNYLHWQRDRQEAAVVSRAIRYAVEQFSPAYLDFLRKHRSAPRDNLDLNLAPPRDTLWMGLSRAEIYPNGDLHMEYPSPDAKRQPLLVWHIDVRDNALKGPHLCGARDIPQRVLDWNGLDCDGDVAVPAKDADSPALRQLKLPAREASQMDDVLDAVRRNDPDALAALKDSGRDLCGTSTENITAFGEAARGNQTKAVVVLAGACDINQLEPFTGRTALMIAAAIRNVETVQALLAAGAGVEVRDAAGDSAWFALGTGSDDASQQIRRMLLSKGGAIDARAGDGATLLMRAADAGDASLAGWLLQGGAKVDLQDTKGRTPVMYAALSARGDLVLQLLLTRKPDLELKDADGKTALALTQDIKDERRRWEVTQTLKAAGKK